MVAFSKGVEFFGARDGMVFHGCGGMHGGYPQATGYRLYATDTNMLEIIKNEKDYPLGDPDPGNGEFERLLKGNIVRKKNCTIYPITLKNYDLFHYVLSGGPGYGDPLERNLESAKKDLDNGIYTKEYVYNIYGIVASYDNKKQEWIIDEVASKNRRDDIKKYRIAKSIPYEEFWEKERKKITDGALSDPVRLMFSQSLEISKGYWGKEFREFWKLPEDFKMEAK
jgi:hypothetical protein